MSVLEEKVKKNPFWIILLVNFIVFGASFFIDDQYKMYLLNTNSEENRGLISWFLSNFAHYNFLHFFLNMFFGSYIVKNIFLHKQMTVKDFFVFNFVGALLIGIVLNIYLTNFASNIEFHLGYSAILFGLYYFYMFSIKSIYDILKDTIVLIVIYLIIENVSPVNISHIGHIIGVFFGLLFYTLKTKKY